MQQLEAREQEWLFRWAEVKALQYPELSLLYHIPNGGKRNAKEAANLKRQGVKAGVPDLCLPVARGKYHGVYIELKAGKNTTTAKQDEWIQKLDEQGYLSLSCNGWNAAAEILESYLKLPKGETL